MGRRRRRKFNTAFFSEAGQSSGHVAIHGLKFLQSLAYLIIHPERQLRQAGLPPASRNSSLSAATLRRLSFRYSTSPALKESDASCVCEDWGGR